MINGERVIFNMATMPQRIKALQDTINTILPQCDELNIYLNNFAQVPDFLTHAKINCFRSQDHLGDMGDVGKFFRVANQKGYLFTVDDKILYAPDYVIQMVETIERTHRKAAISNHGRNFYKNRPSKSYYFDIEESFSYQLTYPLTFVHEVGTGVLAWHSDLVMPTLSWFPNSNMTDIYFSIECQKRGIPLVIHPHVKGWLKLGTKHDENYSIHSFCNRSDEFQTKVVNDFDWQILTCEVDKHKPTFTVKPEKKPENLQISIAGLSCNYRAFGSIAIVIPVLNNLDFTKKVLSGIKCMKNPVTVILIDDGSTDGTQEFMLGMVKQRYPLIYHRHNTNLGVNKSWNEGVRIARSIGAEYIAIINNDLELSRDWEIPMLKMLEDKSIGVVSPYSTHGEKLPKQWGASASINPLGFDILGCCFMFRSDLIASIGYIPETLHTYYGDNWFSEQTKAAGMQVVYCPDSLVHHYYQQTTKKTNVKPILAQDAKAWAELTKQ